MGWEKYIHNDAATVYKMGVKWYCDTLIIQYWHYQHHYHALQPRARPSNGENDQAGKNDNDILCRGNDLLIRYTVPVLVMLHNDT